MNPAQALVDYLIDHQLIDATLGQNLFIARTPAQPDTLWSVKLQTPASGLKALTGELQQPVTVDIYYRSRDAKDVYDTLHRLSNLLNSVRHLDLEGYTVSEFSTSGPVVDQDIDSEERLIGLLSVTLTTYKENRYVIS